VYIFHMPPYVADVAAIVVTVMKVLGAPLLEGACKVSGLLLSRAAWKKRQIIIVLVIALVFPVPSVVHKPS